MANELKELRDKIAEIATKARTKFDEITDDTPEDRAAEIEREFDAMMAEHDKLEARADRLERVERAQKAAEERGDPRRPKGEDTEARGEGDLDDGKAPDYGAAFEKALRYGVSGLTSEERGILRTMRPGIPDEVRAQASGTDAAGGYLVPEGFSGEIDKAMAAWGPMWDANIVREWPTATGNRVPWPTVDDTAQTGEQHAENAAATDDGTGDVVFSNAVFDAYWYNTKVVRIPWELLDDSAFDMEDLLTDLFGERLGRYANTLLTTGDGTGKPNGILTASSLGKTAAAVASITSDELIDLQHSIDPNYRSSPKCRWQFNDTTLATIRKLKDGQGNYLWQMGDVRTGEPNTLLGHPYSVNQAMPAMTTGLKPILFGDHGKFVVRKVRDFQVMTLRERYAESFQVGMIGFKRFDSDLLRASAVKHLIMA